MEKVLASFDKCWTTLGQGVGQLGDKFLDKCSILFGQVLDTFWTSIEHFLDKFSILFGYFLGKVWELFVIYLKMASELSFWVFE